MKNLRMVLGKMEAFVASSPPDDGNFLFATNLSSVTPLRVVSLADNNSSHYSDVNYNAPYNFNFRLDPSLVIVMFGLLGFIFFFGFFCVFCCRRTTNDQGSRRAGGNNNVRGAATRGLERTVIESFPVFSYNLVKGLKTQAKGSECAVCLSDFEDEEMVRLLPKCSHAFHPECIDMWLSSHTTCPICRTSLLPGEEPNPTGTDLGVVEPQTPPEQVAIVIDNGGGVSRHGSICRDTSNEEATNGAPVTIPDSTGHSLIRVQNELEQPTEWYMATPRGLTPGLYRSCSFVAMHHSQGPSTSNSHPACSKAGDSMDDGACRSSSERWGSIPVNPASFLRSFSEHNVPQPAEQQDRRAYLKRTLSWLMGRNRGSVRGDRSQSGSRSSRHADQSTESP